LTLDKLAGIVVKCCDFNFCFKFVKQGVLKMLKNLRSLLQRNTKYNQLTFSIKKPMPGNSVIRYLSTGNSSKEEVLGSYGKALDDHEKFTVQLVEKAVDKLKDDMASESDKTRQLFNTNIKNEVDKISDTIQQVTGTVKELETDTKLKSDNLVQEFKTKVNEEVTKISKQFDRHTYKFLGALSVASILAAVGYFMIKKDINKTTEYYSTLNIDLEKTKNIVVTTIKEGQIAEKIGEFETLKKQLNKREERLEELKNKLENAWPRPWPSYRSMYREMINNLQSDIDKLKEEIKKLQDDIEKITGPNKVELSKPDYNSDELNAKESINSETKTVFVN
jgi:hypothetical protein